jgi:4'-phosphopantetheinyl transferase
VKPATHQLIGLAQGKVHLWCTQLDRLASEIKALQQTLSADERTRAARYHFQKDRDQFVVARGLLRTLLGRYLGVSPEHLRFRYNAYGKPGLNSEFDGGTLRFNLSHSHGLVLYALTRGRDIGVDVEHIRPEFAEGQIAERFFSPREVTLLRRLPVALQPIAFFHCWTRKEAFIKARGEGMTLPLDQFDVSLTPGEPARLLHTQWDPQEPLRWSLRELAPAPGYVGAVAVEGGNWQIEWQEWPEYEFLLPSSS